MIIFVFEIPLLSSSPATQATLANWREFVDNNVDNGSFLFFSYKCRLMDFLHCPSLLSLIILFFLISLTFIN